MGTPAQVRDYLRRYEECGVDQVILSCSAGRNRHDHIMETLELFAREVMPEFVERHEAQARRPKAARLEPVIAAVMARKPAERPPSLRSRLRDPRLSPPRRRPTGQRQVPPLARRLRRENRIRRRRQQTTRVATGTPTTLNPKDLTSNASARHDYRFGTRPDNG